MDKKIEDCLFLYMNVKCLYSSDDKEFYPLTGDRYEIVRQNKAMYEASDWSFVLRPLSDMTEEEMKDFILIDLNIKNTLKKVTLCFDATKIYYETTGFVGNSHMDLIRCSSDQFIYLLKQGFDLFGLIESGLAISKLSVTSEKPKEILIDNINKQDTGE